MADNRSTTPLQRRVLVIDAERVGADDELLQALREHGDVPVLANSMEEALRVLHSGEAAHVALLSETVADQRGMGHAVRWLRSEGRSIPVIVLCRPSNMGAVVEAIKAGANDAISLPAVPANAIAMVDTYAMPPQARPRFDLTPRESLVAECLLAGYTGVETGNLLGISPRTVELHRGNVANKLGARTAIELGKKLAEWYAERDGESGGRRHTRRPTPSPNTGPHD